MESFMTYKDWEPILEQEEDCKVIDPDGMRMVIREGKEMVLMTKANALRYFYQNTMMFGPKFIEKMRNK